MAEPTRADRAQSDGANEDALGAWLDRAMRTAATLTLRSGLHSRRGIEAIRRRLERLLVNGGHIFAVVGGNPLQDDPGALRTLWEMHQAFPSQTRFYVFGGPGFMNATTYHVEHVDGRCSAWVGSAGLTLGGLVVNDEAAVILDSADDDSALLENVRAATRGVARRPFSVPLDRDVLTAREVPPQAPSGPGPGWWRSQMLRSVATTERRSNLLDRLATTNNGDCPRGVGVVPTGLNALDRAIQGGLRPGALTVLAGDDDTSLSTLAMNIAMRVAAGAGRPASLHAV